MNNNNYYEPDYDEVAAGERLQETINYMLKTDADFDVTDSYNLGEAIQECSDADQQAIRDYVQQKDWAKLGLKLYTISLEYQERMAYNWAIKE